MGRLIDAEQTKLMLSELLQISEKENFTVDDAINHAFEWIDRLPTAYDEEKVKKEIDRVGKSFCDYVACNEECTSCEHHSIMNAVTGIVSKGGVE